MPQCQVLRFECMGQVAMKQSIEFDTDANSLHRRGTWGHTWCSTLQQGLYDLNMMLYASPFGFAGWRKGSAEVDAAKPSECGRFEEDHG